ncbi:hypothetical protein SLS62_008545 [Diatrype stigma]|uniref:Uncharacterized protein n=1 Tax=Diatrype stigma TaxID=117547 RepID=A0AAN9YN55_9PEZI
MGVDSLKNLIANVPDWLRRLDELNGQIEQRQLDLAKYEETQEQKNIAKRSLKRTNSTESLKPKDDGAAFPTNQCTNTQRDTTPPPDSQNVAQQQEGEQPPQNGTAKGGSPKSTSSTIQRQTKEAITAAQRRARAVVRKRQKTDSVISMEDGTIKYRSRIMIIVYYDSYVQSFFEELVKFVSASRNLMRKAKMAAKVAEIKRLAELEMPDDEDEDSGNFRPGDGMIAADPRFNRRREEGADDLRPRYPTTRQMGLMTRNLPPSVLRRQVPRPGMAGASSLSGGLGMFNEKGDIYDDLDKGLDFVQSMCEKAAHQFLRDGDCADEVEKIKDRLAKTKEQADKEMERIQEEDPMALEEPDSMKTRSYRPTSMRRDTGAFIPSTKLPLTNTGPLEIDDEGVQDLDSFQPSFKAPRLIS